jgi:transcriptional regulator with XRE-family HTH domain
MKKDKQKVLDRIRQRTTAEQREFVKMNLGIARQIGLLLKKQGLSQKEFAQKMGKQESEISRLLSGTHNFSLKTLAKIKVVLDEEILTTPLEASEKYKSIVMMPLNSYAKPNKIQRIDYPEQDNISVVYRKQTTLKAS